MRVCGCGGGGWGVGVGVLFARNVTLNSDTVPNYKHMASPHMDQLSPFVKHLSGTHIIPNTVMKQSKWLNGDLKAEDKKTTNMTTMGSTTNV